MSASVNYSTSAHTGGFENWQDVSSEESSLASSTESISRSYTARSSSISSQGTLSTSPHSESSLLEESYTIDDESLEDKLVLHIDDSKQAEKLYQFYNGKALSINRVSDSYDGSILTITGLFREAFQEIELEKQIYSEINRIAQAHFERYKEIGDIENSSTEETLELCGVYKWHLDSYDTIAEFSLPLRNDRNVQEVCEQMHKKTQESREIFNKLLDKMEIFEVVSSRVGGLLMKIATIKLFEFNKKCEVIQVQLREANNRYDESVRERNSNNCLSVQPTHPLNLRSLFDQYAKEH